MSFQEEYWNTKCKEFIYLDKLEDKNFANNKKKEFFGQICSNLPKLNNSKHCNWFKAALKSEERKWFVANIFQQSNFMPRELVLPFIEAAINEQNASLNRFFIQPCVKKFGAVEVQRVLNDYLLANPKLQLIDIEKVQYWIC